MYSILSDPLNSVTKSEPERAPPREIAQAKAKGHWPTSTPLVDFREPRMFSATSHGTAMSSREKLVGYRVIYGHVSSAQSGYELFFALAAFVCFVRAFIIRNTF